MAIPNDPKTRRHAAPRTVALQAPDLCLWCFGTGTYLEALDGDRPHEYVPVICDSCEGSGHRRR
jgi:hypothetical protein